MSHILFNIPLPSVAAQDETEVVSRRLIISSDDGVSPLRDVEIPYPGATALDPASPPTPVGDGIAWWARQVGPEILQIVGTFHVVGGSTVTATLTATDDANNVSEPREQQFVADDIWPPATPAPFTVELVAEGEHDDAGNPIPPTPTDPDGSSSLSLDGN